MKDKIKLDISKFSRVLKYLLYFSEFALFFILQSLPSGFPLIFSVKPMLVLSLLITVSLLESEMSTVFFALIIGFLLDVGLVPVGLSSLFLTIACTLLSALSKKKFHVTIFSSLVSTLLLTSLYMLFVFIAVYVIPGNPRAFVILIDRIIPSVLYTALVSPLVYILNLYIYKAFSRKLTKA